MVQQLADLRVAGERAKEASVPAAFDEIRAKAIAEFTNDDFGEDSCVSAEPGHLAGPLLPGVMAPLFPPGVGIERASAWRVLRMAAVVQGYLLKEFHSADVGLSSLQYKAPPPPKAGKTSEVRVGKLWTDQSVNRVQLFLIGKVIVASCGLASGSKAVCCLGPVPVDESGRKGMMSFFVVPTSNMTAPNDSQRTPRWMVRVIKPKGDQKVDLEEPETEWHRFQNLFSSLSSACFDNALH